MKWIALQTVRHVTQRQHALYAVPLTIWCRQGFAKLAQAQNSTIPPPKRLIHALLIVSHAHPELYVQHVQAIHFCSMAHVSIVQRVTPSITQAKYANQTAEQIAPHALHRPHAQYALYRIASCQPENAHNARLQHFMTQSLKLANHVPRTVQFAPLQQVVFLVSIAPSFSITPVLLALLATPSTTRARTANQTALLIAKYVIHKQSVWRVTLGSAQVWLDCAFCVFRIAISVKIKHRAMSVALGSSCPMEPVWCILMILTLTKMMKKTKMNRMKLTEKEEARLSTT